MKSSTLRYHLLAIALFCSLLATQAASYSVPKREFRSAWVATVWGLDWPSIGAKPETQKNAMRQLLDSLKTNNFNAVNFQVRSMCDAMYKSSYEPWSSYLTGTRGKDPGYDPLQFVVEECHKRGMECHAWVNPYRFSTGSNWNTEMDQELQNSGHLLTYGNTTVLDPGQQWTIDRIVAVCREIVTNYDVDGILYDDYFYPNGIPTNETAGDYQEWRDSGIKMSLGDWRRDNVNKMVKAVNDMIQTVKPWVRYGISPAGVACTQQSMADKYGIQPCPSGSDWQYNGIFSEPLAWISAHTIDYISPQVYWKIGATADYGKITPWWNQVAEHFGRQCYISQNIYTGIGAHSDSTQYVEVARETELNRTSSVDGNPGAIYYSCKYLYKMGAQQSLGNYLKSTVFTRPALPPVITWKQGNNPGPVQNLARDGQHLSWEGHEGARYSVYAFPSTMNTSTFSKQVEYLLGMTYEPSYELTAGQAADNEFQYAVCVVDRVGNEYDPVFLGTPLAQLGTPTLIAPAAGATVDEPFHFTWHQVHAATTYVVELSNEADFGHVVEQHETADTTLLSTSFSQLQHDHTQYWRVVASADQHYSGVSEVRAIKPMRLTITYPVDGQEELNDGFTATWYAVGSSEEATVEIANTIDFAENEVVFTGHSATGELAIPSGTLDAGNTYYMRVSLTVDGVNIVSNPVRFNLAHQATHFVTPTDGGVLFPDQYVAVKAQKWANSYVIEISASKNTWGRTRYVETLKDGATQSNTRADSIKVNGKFLTLGQTYYARTKTNYKGFDQVSHSTDYGDIISFTYALRGDVNSDGQVNVSDVTELVNKIIGTGEASDAVCDLNSDGTINATDVTALINIILGHP